MHGETWEGIISLIKYLAGESACLTQCLAASLCPCTVNTCWQTDVLLRREIHEGLLRDHKVL